MTKIRESEFLQQIAERFPRPRSLIRTEAFCECGVQKLKRSDLHINEQNAMV